MAGLELVLLNYEKVFLLKYVFYHRVKMASRPKLTVQLQPNPQPRAV